MLFDLTTYKFKYVPLFLESFAVLHVTALGCWVRYSHPFPKRFLHSKPALTPWRLTAQLTSKRCILNIYSTNILAKYFKHAAHSPFFVFKMPFIS